MNNCQYIISPVNYHQKLTKKNGNGQIIYTNEVESDAGWEEFDLQDRYYITWTGDFYTLHATDDGAVLTKYTLNHPPVAEFTVVTSMPYASPAPAVVEFDACGSYDPDPEDTITYHWDFDGDSVFDETVDDAYTGDPDNPSHGYYQSYTGPVKLKVIDNHDAESDICTTTVVVIVTQGG